MNIKDIYTTEDGKAYYKDEKGLFYILSWITVPSGIGASDLKKAATKVMETYRDQPFKFYQSVRVRDKDYQEWRPARFLAYVEGSELPYMAIDSDYCEESWRYCEAVPCTVNDKKGNAHTKDELLKMLKYFE